MYIKVACACGCRYGFDVTPVNGLMPVGVNCPKCGMDGTAKADALLAMVAPKSAQVPVITANTAPAQAPVLAAIPLPLDDKEEALPAAIALPAIPAIPASALPAPPTRPPAIALPVEDQPTTPVPARSSIVNVPPPPPPATIAPAPPPPPALPASGLTVKRRAPEEHSAPTPATAPASTAAPASSGGLKVKGVAPSTHAPTAASNATPSEPATEKPSESAIENPHVRIGYMPKDGPEPSFPRGLLGAFIGTVVGSLIWYTIFHFGDIDFGWLALLPAAMSGMLGRKMAREDNHWIGVSAAVFTLIAIFGTRYAIASKEMDKRMGGIDTEAIFETYDEKLAEAKEAVAAKTDDDIKNFLQNQHRRQFEKFAEKGEKFQPVGIEKEDVDDFKEFDLPEYKDFANGKPSREEYEQDIKSAKQAGTWATRIVTIFSVIISTGILGIFSLIFALAVAYRTGSG